MSDLLQDLDFSLLQEKNRFLIHSKIRQAKSVYFNKQHLLLGRSSCPHVLLNRRQN